MLTPPPTDIGGDGDIVGWRVGDVVAYRCEDCLDRWDLVLDDVDLLGDIPDI